MELFILPVLLAYALPLQSEGSKLASALDGRIVGGVEASIQQFPHQISLQMYGKHACGAVIIDAQTLLTAAHCVDETSPLMYTARAGSSESNRGGTVIPVQRIIIHESFNSPTSLNNDIALLILEKPLNFDRSMQPISLMTPHDFLLPTAHLFVSGWGSTSEGSRQVAAHLRYTVVQQIDQTLCAAAYRSTTKITDTMLCAGAENGGRDSCQGDSGGPLVTFVNGSIKLVGIVSWGIGCAHASFPGVYTRAAEYISWITNKTAETGGHQLIK